MCSFRHCTISINMFTHWSFCIFFCIFVIVFFQRSFDPMWSMLSQYEKLQLKWLCQIGLSQVFNLSNSLSFIFHNLFFSPQCCFMLSHRYSNQHFWFRKNNLHYLSFLNPTFFPAKVTVIVFIQRIVNSGKKGLHTFFTHLASI